MTRVMPRLPFDPLYRLARGDRIEHTGGCVCEGRHDSQQPRIHGHCWSIAAFARLIGVDHGQVHRWRREGLTPWAADRAAVACGYHPAEVWGDLWWDTCGLVAS